MQSISKLRAATADALEYVSAQPDVEVFASADANLTVRLNYTSHIPSNGVEEPKSAESFGMGLRVVFRPGPDGERRTGFGSEPNDLSLEGARSALHKARARAVVDPEFVSLPQPDKLVQPRADSGGRCGVASVPYGGGIHPPAAGADRREHAAYVVRHCNGGT